MQVIEKVKVVPEGYNGAGKLVQRILLLLMKNLLKL